MNIFSHDVIVIGTGAAGYNAAVRLHEFGKDVAIVTEAVAFGTSRNTGSDKQTYYKLGLGGDSPDSVQTMARDLFNGGCVDGDNALCEAALSARCFLNLCELSVPFPHNRYGEYVGYKTDHDPYARATSAGPLTSKYMTEALQKRASILGIPVYDGHLAVEILKYESSVCGLLTVEKATGELTAFRASDVVMCTGGPAGIYADSVYPECHTGSTSIALLAGASAQNLTEWQYGLASVDPRWNVSGTYMQVLPRFISVDKNGCEREFLEDFFEDPYDALSCIFLKGYQWPFDSRKVLNGSSVIDLLVYRECVLRGNRVFLDYTKNPFGLEKIEFDRLSTEAFEYLSKAEATFGTPIERLAKMNTPAIELYGSFGVDITKTPLEIALCAQHNNGGIAVDMWWQSSLAGLFCAGECAGTHGVSRPGGSALNAGQVGSLRAAQYIAKHGRQKLDENTFKSVAENAAEAVMGEIKTIIGSDDNADTMISKAQRRMSDSAAAIRNRDAICDLIATTKAELEVLGSALRVSDKSRLYMYFKARDILVTQLAVACAMDDFAKHIGNTRGSCLYTDVEGDLRYGLEEIFRFKNGDVALTEIQEVHLCENSFVSSWRNVRPIPDNTEAFETVWRSYRENGNIC